VTGSEKFDWWKWLKGRFGTSSTEEKPPPVESPPPPRKRHRRPKDDAFVWPDGEEYWSSRPYRKDDWKDWFKFGYHLCKKGEIGSTTPREKAVWQAEKTADGQEHLYVACVKCAAVNDFANHRIDKDGKVNPCIVCVKCGEHTWIRLGEWAGGERKETRTAEDFVWEKNAEKWAKESEEWWKESEKRWKEFDRKYPRNGKKDGTPGSGDLYGPWC